MLQDTQGLNLALQIQGDPSRGWMNLSASPLVSVMQDHYLQISPPLPYGSPWSLLSPGKDKHFHTP